MLLQLWQLEELVLALLYLPQKCSLGTRGSYSLLLLSSFCFFSLHALFSSSDVPLRLHLFVSFDPFGVPPGMIIC